MKLNLKIKEKFKNEDDPKEEDDPKSYGPSLFDGSHTCFNVQDPWYFPVPTFSD